MNLIGSAIPRFAHIKYRQCTNTRSDWQKADCFGETKTDVAQQPMAATNICIDRIASRICTSCTAWLVVGSDVPHRHNPGRESEATEGETPMSRRLAPQCARMTALELWEEVMFLSWSLFFSQHICGLSLAQQEREGYAAGSSRVTERQ